MYRIVGYCDRWSARPGEAVRFMVSSVGDAPFDLRFVRLLCPDPNPDGPGYSEVAMPTGLDGKQPGFERPAYLGSYGHAAGLKLGSDTIRLSATVWPTTPGKGLQGILALEGKGGSFALAIGPGGGAAAIVARANAAPTIVEVKLPLQQRGWAEIVATYAPDGTVTVEQRAHRPHRDVGEARGTAPAVAFGGAANVFVAALPPDGVGAPACAHYNGKIERPTVECHVAALDRWQSAAQWDFAADIAMQTAPDTHGAASPLGLINFPARAMTGSNWTGAIHDWRRDPAQYGAIHFHDDDHGDTGWPTSFELRVPDDWPTGFYAAHVRSDAAEDMIPFFVRPRAPQADVAFLVPTFTYQVYGNHFRPGRGAEIAARAAAWHALPETPDMNPQFGMSTYQRHGDGSGISVASLLRPMFDTRPKQISVMDPAPGASGAGRICADAYVSQWMREEGVAHDIVTDHELHAEGIAAIAPYRVLIAGQHPEYLSERMMQAIEAFLEAGGRLMYLGGNGFYWRAEPSATHPHALEVRRAEGGIRTWETQPGESYHAFADGYGGLWRRIGRPSHKLVGIGFSTQGRYSGFPYRFTAAVADPRVAFMFDGVDAEPGAEFGAFGYMGGGAAGFELDSVNSRYGTPAHALVVAKGVVLRPDYSWVNEDMLTEIHPRPREAWSCADMTFFETPAGGAVFSVGSMTFVGALPIAGQLRRLTTNVLARFRDPAPFELPR